MAKLAASVATFALLLSFSHALLLPDLQASQSNPEDALPKSHELDQEDPATTNTILIPANKPRSDEEPRTVTVINFRPINRHFPTHLPTLLRHRHHCDHHRRFHSLGLRFQKRDSSSDEFKGLGPMIRSGAGWTHPRMVEIHRRREDEPRFSFGGQVEFQGPVHPDGGMKHFGKAFDQENGFRKRLTKFLENVEVDDTKGVMKGIRKFFNKF